MADYLTHDLRVDLGNDLPEDTTLNVLRFPERNTTLVIARNTLAQDQDLDAALAPQLDVLRNRDGAMTLTETQATWLGPERQVEGREMALQFTFNDTPCFQLQVACLVPGQRRLMVMNYSKASPLSAADIEHWRSIKRGLRFT